jgi:Flp pilus assembly protein TadD
VSTTEEGEAQWVSDLCRLRRPTLLLAAGITCLELREHEAALAVLELCTKLEPDNPEAHLLTGKSLLALERTEEAARALGQAMRLDPGCFEAKSLLVWCYSSAG